MFFSKKKEDRIQVEDIGNNRRENIPVAEYDDYKMPRTSPTYTDIREAMEESPSYTEPAKRQYTQPAVSRPAVQRTYEEQPAAPLFVKVERYREVLRDVHEMKLYVSGIKQLLDLMHDIETIRIDAWKIMRATIQRIDKTLVEVDSELLRPKGSIMSEIATGDAEAKHMEGSLAELQRQLAELKRELQDFK